MDFKAVEMQVALPRTFEAAKPLQDHRQTVQAAEQYAQAETKKETEWKGKAVSQGSDINKMGERDREKQHGEQQQRKKKQQKKAYAHPYKGQQIDFSG